MPSFAHGAAFFTGVSLKIDAIAQAKLIEAAKHIRDEAKRVLGTYEYGWTSLAQSTIEKKTRGDSPGLETGMMKRSVHIAVVGKHEVIIGTDLPRASYFELGTSRQPPRPWLGEAGYRCESHTKQLLGHHVFKEAFEGAASLLTLGATGIAAGLHAAADAASDDED